MKTCDSDKELIISELKVKVSTLEEINGDLVTSLNQAKNRLQSFHSLSNDLLKMRGHLKKLTEALLQKRKEVKSLKGQIAAAMAIVSTDEPLRKTEGSNEILYSVTLEREKGVQEKKLVVNEEETKRHSRQPTADLPPLVEQEDEEENYDRRS